MGLDCMMRRLQQVGRLLPLFAVLALMLTGCSSDPYLSTLTPKGPAAEMQLFMMELSLYVMLFVFAVVVAIFAYVLVRYRKRKGDEGIPEQVEGNHKLEIIWTVIPFLLLIVIAVPMVSTTFTLAKDYSQDKDAVKVKVTAHQFWWEFDYPEAKIKTAQELYIPVGKKVWLELTSTDVIHSFWVPGIAGKTDTNPGMTNTMWLEASEEGVFQGKCAELCGASHALMDFKVKVVSQDEFDAWVAKMSKEKPESSTEGADTALATEGQEIFQKSCVGCHAIDGNGGKLGPDLSDYSERETVAGFLRNDPQHTGDDAVRSENLKKNLHKWLSNPEEVKPGNLMKIPQLKPEEVDALTEYLSNLKRQ